MATLRSNKLTVSATPRCMGDHCTAVRKCFCVSKVVVLWAVKTARGSSVVVLVASTSSRRGRCLLLLLFILFWQLRNGLEGGQIPQKGTMILGTTQQQVLIMRTPGRTQQSRRMSRERGQRHAGTSPQIPQFEHGLAIIARGCEQVQALSGIPVQIGHWCCCCCCLFDLHVTPNLV